MKPLLLKSYKKKRPNLKQEKTWPLAQPYSVSQVSLDKKYMSCNTFHKSQPGIQVTITL